MTTNIARCRGYESPDDSQGNSEPLTEGGGAGRQTSRSLAPLERWYQPPPHFVAALRGRPPSGVLLLLLLLILPTPPTAAQSIPDGGWPYFGGDHSFQRYSPLDRIDEDNVDRLQLLWRRPGVDPALTAGQDRLPVPRYLKSTPVLIEGILYASNALGLVEAFDPGTGETIWVQRPPDTSMSGLAGQSTRGVDHWFDGRTQRILSIRDQYLYALDARSGAPIDDFGRYGRVLLVPPGADRFRSSSGPIVVGDVIVVGGAVDGAGDDGSVKEATPEDVRGFDARTGRLLWTFHVVPREGEPGAETWGDDSWRFSGDLGSWCCLSADEERGLVYVPLSAPTAAYYGGHRPGENLFSNSLVALSATTGSRVWHFQMVHHDLWEYDTVGPPILGRLTTADGRTIDAVMQPNKNAFLYVFDRESGEPVWPIEERAVPDSDIPGEQVSPTQPIPSRPPAFDVQGVTRDDLVDFTPEIRRRALKAVEPYRLGAMYEPPSIRSQDNDGKQGTLIVPGSWGAANWNTGAFDPETGYYYAVSHTIPNVYAMAPPENPEATMRFENVWGRTPTVDGLPVTKPPYGRVTALDLTRGEIAWTAANGEGPKDHPLLEGLDLPDLGIPGRAAPLVTGSLLFIGEGSDAVIGIREGMWGRTFRAYDKQTGRVIWEKELEAGTTGAPMTYLHGGRQYIVVAIGGSDHPAEWVALGLPPD